MDTPISLPYANTSADKKEEAGIFSRSYYTRSTFRWWTTHPYRDHTVRHLVDYLKEARPMLPLRSKVLEPACGCGVNLTNLARHFPDFDYCGLDLSLEGCHVGQTCGNGHYVVGDAEDIPFTTGTFDICLCIAAIHHFWRRPERFLSEMHRVLREGGVLYIFEPDVNLRMGLGQKLLEKWVKFRIQILNEGKQFSEYLEIPHSDTEGPFPRELSIRFLLSRGMRMVRDGYSEYLTEWARHFQNGFELAAQFDRMLKPERSGAAWKIGGTKYYAIMQK